MKSQPSWGSSKGIIVLRTLIFASTETVHWSQGLMNIFEHNKRRFKWCPISKPQHDCCCQIKKGHEILLAHSHEREITKIAYCLKQLIHARLTWEYTFALIRTTKNTREGRKVIVKTMKQGVPIMTNFPPPCGLFSSFAIFPTPSLDVGQYMLNMNAHKNVI